MKRDTGVADRLPVPGAVSRGFDSSGILRRMFANDAKTAACAAALGAILIVIAGVPLAAALNIWIDEAFTLHTTGAGPINAWQQAILFEDQPPLYFVLEALWRIVDEGSIAVARFPSVVFAGATVAVIVMAAHRFAPRVPPLVVALTTAINPLFIWAAVEMRVYALVLFIGAVLVWSFVEGFIVDRPSRYARICYVIAAIAGLYAQYYVGFVLVAQALTLLVLRRRAIGAYLVAGALVAAAFAPFLRAALVQVASSGDFVSRATLIKAVHEVVDAVVIFVLPHEVNWSGATKAAGFAVSILLLVMLLVAGRPQIRAKNAQAIALQWLICCVIFSLLFWVSGVPFNPLRHLTVIAPLSILAAFILVASADQRRVLVGTIAIACFAVFAGATLWTDYRPPLAKAGEWQRVAGVLSAGDRTTPIAVFPAELALPLERYLPTTTIPIPRTMPFTTDYVRASTLTSEADVARVLDPVHAESQRLWIVTWSGCRDPKIDSFSYNCQYLETYLNRRYRLVESVAFRGALVRLYVRVSSRISDSAVRRNAD